MNILLRRFPSKPVLTILEKEVRRLQDIFILFHDRSQSSKSLDFAQRGDFAQC
jgi:hypothetical protein